MTPLLLIGSAAEYAIVRFQVLSQSRRCLFFCPTRMKGMCRCLASTTFKHARVSSALTFSKWHNMERQLRGNMPVVALPISWSKSSCPKGCTAGMHVQPLPSS
eukprot:2153904-Amphidinium_carterae.3